MKKVALLVAGLLMIGSIGFGASFAEANGDSATVSRIKSKPSTTASAIHIEKTTGTAIKVKPSTTASAIHIEKTTCAAVEAKVKPSTTASAVTTGSAVVQQKGKTTNSRVKSKR